jgi:hypothetical protein
MAPSEVLRDLNNTFQMSVHNEMYFLRFGMVCMIEDSSNLFTRAADIHLLY